MSTAQAHTKCVSAFWADSGARHFSCKFLDEVALIVKFLYKMALVKCGARHFGCKFLHHHHHRHHHHPPHSHTLSSHSPTLFGASCRIIWFPGLLVSWFPKVQVSGCCSFLVSWFLISQCQSWLPFCSLNSVSALRGSYGRCKGRCLIRVLALGAGIFPVNFSIKWLL